VSDPQSPSPSTSVSDLQADIERTRAELADTVDQLAARLDVKTRVRDRLITPEGRPTTTAYVVGTAVVLALTAMVVRGVRRKEHR